MTGTVGSLWLAAAGAGIVPPRHLLLHTFRLPHPSSHAPLVGPTLIGLSFGLLATAMLLRVDHAPFPSRPHGRINYMFLGFVASVLGTMSPTALITGNYTAGVFLAIGLSQFHMVRNIERQMLTALEDAQVVPRGRAYVEGLAMMLETRDYLAMAVALTASAFSLLFGILGGAAAGFAAAVLVAAAARSGSGVGSMGEVSMAEVRFAQGEVRVGGLTVLRDAGQEVAGHLPHALGIRVRPRDLAARLTLAEPGQRQAIVHNLTAHLGVRVGGGLASAGTGVDEALDAHAHRLLPHDAVDIDSGSLAILLFPQVHDPKMALRVVRQTPRLENLAHRSLRGLPPGGEQAP